MIGFEVESLEEKQLLFGGLAQWGSGVYGGQIGMGYDLGYVTREEFLEDWNGKLSDVSLRIFSSWIGLRGRLAGVQRARDADLDPITWETAHGVFMESTIPRIARKCAAAYPGVGRLPPDAQTMMWSLVYSRGDTTQHSGDDRKKEMAELIPAVKDRKLDVMADLFLSMRRLFTDDPGSVKRRETEAEVIRNSDRGYTRRDIIIA